ncbi:MAG: glycosyltransferase family 4 protein [Methanoregula sp.]|nr:glycosyltransferase family 4 protein [Methanoregula sp.]
MKIGINLLPLRPGENGGHELYVRNLLMKLSTIDPDNEYFLITAPYNDSSLHFPQRNFKKIYFHSEITLSEIVRYIIGRIFRKMSSSEITLKKIISRYHFDLWFCPFSNLEPRPVKIPSIVTIPDIQHEYYPGNFSNTELLSRKRYIKPSVEMTTEIITESDFSKKCFMEKLGVDPQKIHVIPLSADDRFSNPSKKASDVIKKFSLPDEYFLYPANGWPHKNHLALIEGFSLYRKSFSTPLHLVLTGRGLQGTAAVMNLIAQNNISAYVHILGYVENEDLPGLYKNAKALVFPSLFEGFGIPLLEAMAMGCPVIASDATCIPEVAGDAAYFFDAKNPRSICDAMHRIIDDNALREQLIRNGKNRVTRYSYEEVARRHLAVFASAFSKTEEVEIAYRNRNNVNTGTQTAMQFFQKKAG